MNAKEEKKWGNEKLFIIKNCLLLGTISVCVVSMHTSIELLVPTNDSTYRLYKHA